MPIKQSWFPLNSWVIYSWPDSNLDIEHLGVTIMIQLANYAMLSVSVDKWKKQTSKEIVIKWKMAVERWGKPVTTSPPTSWKPQC